MAIIDNTPLSRLLIRLLALAMIAVMGIVFHNYHANWHYHGLQSGIVIKHAHPLPENAAGTTEHSHSETEFFRLEQLFQAVSSILIAIVLVLLLFIKTNLIVLKPSPACVLKGYNNLSFIRGPPQFLA